MKDVGTFGLIVLVVAGAAIVAVLSNRLAERIRVPAPAIFLIAAAVLSDLAPSLYDLSTTTVQRIVTVALAIILFDGGMHIGMARLRSAAGAIVWLGVVGTAVTTAGVALIAHALLGLGAKISLVLGTALAPTDPAVVFSVLGNREVRGRAGTILEGESGANDPVGIALMIGLLTASGSGARLALGVAQQFALEMAIGLAIGVVGGVLLLAFMRRIPLPNAALYPIRALAGALVLYGVATVAHGSGFLAVFVAGIVVGDERAPYKAEIERFCSSLATLGEIVAFAVLGLTVHLSHFRHGHALGYGLAIAALLALVVRPVLGGLVLAAIGLSRPERIFVLWSGLKGAVPILLGSFVLSSGIAHAAEVYDVIAVVVAFSVIVQGGLVPTIARRVGVPMRAVEPEPWAAGLRLRDEPQGLHRYVVEAGSAADGSAVRDLAVGESLWISIVTRAGRLVPVGSDLVLHAGDEVLALTDPGDEIDPAPVFRGDE
ncbi:MAG: sodium:proton exchanger [Pseudonocardiales bacterium]|nr:MAG: sodium:proton exchanger [Pseudonocardiales bacterium]